MDTPLIGDAKQVVTRLKAAELRLVLAESCTGGLISATLTRVPGVSEWLCGSAVTYREDTKVRWIEVSRDDIDQHTAVSTQVAHQMATGVLDKTPEADVSAAITGHFGPDAPDGQDGMVFVAVATRKPSCEVTEHRLESDTRDSRQTEAAGLVFGQLLKHLPSSSKR